MIDIKKFVFSLEKALEHKRFLLDQAKEALARLRVDLARLEQARRETAERILYACREYKEKISGGFRVYEVNFYSGHIKELTVALENLDARIKRLVLEIERQMDRVAAASAEVKALEKLREKRLAEYLDKARKEEELMIGEYVSFGVSTAEASA